MATPKPKTRESPTSDAAKLKRAELSRLKIAADRIIERLQKHIDGKCDLTPTQVAAAQTLLKKVLPDMQSAKVDVAVSPVVFNIGTKPVESK